MREEDYELKELGVTSGESGQGAGRIEGAPGEEERQRTKRVESKNRGASEGAACPKGTEGAGS